MVKITFFTVDSSNNFVRYQYTDVSSIENHSMQVNNTKFVSDYDIKSNLLGNVLLMFHIQGDLNLYPLPLNRSKFEKSIDAVYHYNPSQQNPNSIPDELKSVITEYNSLKAKLLSLISTIEDVVHHTLTGIQSFSTNQNSNLNSNSNSISNLIKNPSITMGTQNQKVISLVSKKNLKKYKKWMK